MPFLPSSGPLSINDIRNMFGGPSSPSMANYYRGGAYIPATKSNTVFQPELYRINSSPYSYWQVVIVNTTGYQPGSTNGSNNAIYNNAGIPSGTIPSGNVSSFTYNGVTYYRGSYRQAIMFREYAFFVTHNYFGCYTGVTTTTNINTGIPSSGTISISQFYGAEKP